MLCFSLFLVYICINLFKIGVIKKTKQINLYDDCYRYCRWNWFWETTVVRKIIEQLPANQVSIIPQDSYYKRAPEGVALSELHKMNYDHPDAFDWDLLEQQIKELKEGRAIEQPTYSVPICDRLPETIHVEPTNVIIIEGIMALYRKEMRDMMDLRIYVECRF